MHIKLIIFVGCVVLNTEINASDNSSTQTNLILTDSTATLHISTTEPNEKWLAIAIQDIAHMLRFYKFNKWPLATENYSTFPSISLLHWQVKFYCYKNFFKCIEYLHSQIKDAPYTRKDDVTTVLNNQSIIFDEFELNEANSKCKKSMTYFERSSLPFDNAIEKFKWLMTASYYMCWYTMLGTPALATIEERCDNFANCLDSEFHYQNHDPRANDALPFSCALYSFCPDPCCSLKHIEKLDLSYGLKTNPCFYATGKSKRCKMKTNDNQNFKDIIVNKWNISCYCRTGYKWESRSGLCVDVNECLTEENNCNFATDDCLNLPGSFTCVCKFGFKYDERANKCLKNYELPTMEKDAGTY